MLLLQGCLVSSSCNTLVANQNPNGTTVVSLHENWLNVLEGNVAALTLVRVWMLPATGTFVFPSLSRDFIPILTQFLEAIKLKSFLIKSSIRMLLKILSKLICLLIIPQNHFISDKFCFVRAAHISIVSLFRNTSRSLFLHFISVIYFYHFSLSFSLDVFIRFF